MRQYRHIFCCFNFTDLIQASYTLWEMVKITIAVLGQLLCICMPIDPNIIYIHRHTVDLHDQFTPISRCLLTLTAAERKNTNTTSTTNNNVIYLDNIYFPLL